MTYCKYFNGWSNLIDEGLLNRIVSIVYKLYQSSKVYPEYKSIFKAFNLCNYANVSVVILGYDPYFDGSATGLSFDSAKNCNTLSPALKVIKNSFQSYKDWEELGNFEPDLEKWAKQGVLLLNTSLTVEANKPASHVMLWRPFISSLLRNLGERQTGLIYVLLGDQAKTFKPYIGKFNDIILCKHSAYYARTKTEMPNIFKQIDELTMRKNGFKIKWL